MISGDDPGEPIPVSKTFVFKRSLLKALGQDYHVIVPGYVTKGNWQASYVAMVYTANSMKYDENHRMGPIFEERSSQQGGANQGYMFRAVACEL